MNRGILFLCEVCTPCFYPTYITFVKMLSYQGRSCVDYFECYSFRVHFAYRHWFSETGSLERLDNPTSEQFYHYLPTDFDGQQEPLTVFVQVSIYLWHCIFLHCYALDVIYMLELVS